jgi:hypothetical protein
MVQGASIGEPRWLALWWRPFTVLRSVGLLRSVKARHTHALQALALARSVLSRELRRKGPVLRESGRPRAISDT